MKSSDPIIARSRGKPEDVIWYSVGRDAKRQGDLTEYVRTVYQLCAADRMPDAAIVIAQSCHETGVWSSYWWVERLNPAGLSITGDPDQNAASPTFASGTEAARAQVAHLLLYATGSIGRGGLTPADDPRYAAYRAAYGAQPMAGTLDDLTGRWAVDPRYGDKIAAVGTAIFGEDDEPMPNLNMTRGLIPLPPMVEHIVDVSRRCQGPNDNRGFDWLGKRTIRGVVLHRSQGTWESNQNHFDDFCPGALTDIQCHHGDGRMMRFVRLAAPPATADSPSGWANGRVEGAYGDGKAFVDRYGVNAVNRDLESCEITGFFAQPGETTREDPLDNRAKATLAQWIASRAHDYGITYETFPLIPGEGNRSFVIWHQEFTIGTGKVCPGRTVMEATPDILARARAIMMEAQTGAGPRPPDPPVPPGSGNGPRVPPPLKDGKPYTHVRSGEVWLARTGRMTLARSARPRQYAAANALFTDPVWPKGRRFNSAYDVVGADGKLWVVSLGGHRFEAIAFVPE